ncbi:hypothetical protein [Streptomyces sp. ICC4]|uniref:hypothetical protein n=1 Tax=Streptomyces sp. ICC4 TaxID=2099584 RepID=UPI000DC7CA48|nr:hypothetical protein [Streptomyces sp. ICC4]AWZ09055.1 hypothetical protein DRB89_36185 [Streptomyces sp. ICC4]
MNCEEGKPRWDATDSKPPPAPARSAAPPCGAAAPRSGGGAAPDPSSRTTDPSETMALKVLPSTKYRSNGSS